MPRPSAGKLWLLLGSLLFSLLLSEGLLRIAGYHYSPLKIVRRSTTQRDDRYEEVFRSSTFVFDPSLIWRPRPGAGPFNSEGYPGPVEPLAKREGTYRIIAVGDSNTLGRWDPHGANWPSLLSEEDHHLDVINAGVVGYSSFQGVRRLTEALVYKPDMILVSFGANDAHVVHLSDAEYLREVSWRRWVWTRAGMLRTAQLLVDASDRWAEYGRRGEVFVQRVGPEEYRNNLQEMVRLAREKGVRPVLLTRPFRGSSEDPMAWKSRAPAYNNITREVAAREAVTLVDVYAFFAARNEAFEDESHFNAQGHKEAAKLVYRQIRGLLPPASDRPTTAGSADR
jgi:lysophospholipase L1-like esterase